MCLGGGCEIALHSAQRQPHLELYTGLVETGVGLIPGGGGCKEMLLRAISAAEAVKADVRGDSADIIETLRNVFETIAWQGFHFGGAGTQLAAAERRRCDHHESQPVADGCENPGTPAGARRLHRSGDAHEHSGSRHQCLRHAEVWRLPVARAGYASEHDAKVATHVAKILSGGDIMPGTPLTEQHLLDLEREAFLSLCGERKTLDRIAFTLKSGKPLRN